MKKRFLSFALFAAASMIFFGACGLDTFYTVSPPTTVIHEPVYTSSDFTSNYFHFRSATNATSDTSFNFLGTAVYYRIYASSSTMLSRQSSISAVNTSSDYTAAASKLISFGYQQLNTSDGSIQPLISAEGVEVTIRLCNYGEATLENNEYRARISPITKIPRRSIGNNKTFDFGRYNISKYSGERDMYAPPASGDEDFEAGTVENNKYYVDMYAVALGRDTTYTTYYSQVLHLGSIPIDASAENN